MDFEERGKLLKELCAECDEKTTCKFGCSEWATRADKVNARVGNITERKT